MHVENDKEIAGLCNYCGHCKNVFLNYHKFKFQNCAEIVKLICQRKDSMETTFKVGSNTSKVLEKVF